MRSAPADDAAVAKAPPSSEPALPRGLWAHADRIALIVLLAAGWALIGHVNQWHIGAPPIALALGWLGILLTGRYLWTSAEMAAREGDPSADDGFAGRSPREELEAEKRALLKAIKEVEFDVELGKMSQADADDIIRLYRTRAIEILKELEDEDGRPLSPAERVERELKARLALSRIGGKKKAAEPVAADAVAASVPAPVPVSVSEAVTVRVSESFPESVSESVSDSDPGSDPEDTSRGKPVSP